MRKAVLIAVIIVGIVLVAVVGYLLMPERSVSVPVPVSAGRGECAIEVDIPSVVWPDGYDANIREAVNKGIEKAVADLLDRHEPPGAPAHATIKAAQDTLIEWCRNNYTGSARYIIDVNAKVTQNAGGLLSIRIVDSFKTGNSPEGIRSTGLVFNTMSGKRLSLFDLVRPGQLAAFAVIEHKKILDVGSSYIYASTKQEIETFLAKPTEVAAKEWYGEHGYMTITPDAIIMSYDPGDIGRRVPDGVLNTEVPKSALAGIIKMEL